MRIDMRGARCGFNEVRLQENTFPLQFFRTDTQLPDPPGYDIGNVQLIMVNFGDKRLRMLRHPEIALWDQQQSGAHRKTRRSDKQQLATRQADRRSLICWN